MWHIRIHTAETLRRWETNPKHWSNGNDLKRIVVSIHQPP